MSCGFEDATQNDDYACILHLNNPEKDRYTFERSLDAHRKRQKGSDNFNRMVFPCDIDFSGEHFSDKADFSYTRFLKSAIFNDAVFQKGCNFTRANFTADTSFVGAVMKESSWFIKTQFKEPVSFWSAQLSRANFSGSTFEKNTDFGMSVFSDNALFQQTRFKDEVRFTDGTFAGGVVFNNITFSKHTLFTLVRFEGSFIFTNVMFAELADFEGSVFTKDGEFRDTDFMDGANFRSAKFLSSVRLTGTNTSSVFGGASTFEYATCASDDSLILIGTDLSKCKFIGADVRKFHFIGVVWPRIRGRYGVYDEIARPEIDDQRKWALLEELYRQLKQNYEDRRDYERAGHFHVGEKEMRLRSPKTPVGLRFLLLLYRLVSRYGESYWRPLFWLLILLLITAAITLTQGLVLEIDGTARILSVEVLADWSWALLYALETIVHLSSKGFTASTFGRVITTVAAIVGPVLIALFGFALRQRLKR